MAICENLFFVFQILNAVHKKTVESHRKQTFTLPFAVRPTLSIKPLKNLSFETFSEVLTCPCNRQIHPMAGVDSPPATASGWVRCCGFSLSKPVAPRFLILTVLARLYMQVHKQAGRAQSRYHKTGNSYYIIIMQGQYYFFINVKKVPCGISLAFWRGNCKANML